MVAGSYPHQEKLLAVSEQTGQIHVREFEEAAVNRIEQKIHLINSLGHLAAAKSREGLVKIGPGGELTDRYGDRASTVVLGAQQQAIEHRKAADQEFKHASGHYTMIDAGIGNAWDIERTTRGLFSDFLKKYYLPQTSGRLSREKRTELEAEIKQLQAEQTVKNREAGVRPHQASRKAEDPDLPKLSTVDRLQVLREDPRAGFLPATNREKTQVMAFLDYLDNPAHPLGINNQFFEIHNHQEREKEKQGGAIPGGVRALESIVYEFGDYLVQSNQQLKALQDLEIKILDCPNPRVTLSEEIGPKHPGYAPLVRYMDLATIRDGGQVDGIKDPLLTKEDRWAKSKDPGKHKTVHDIYTHPNPSDIVTERISEQVHDLTIGELRGVIAEAVTDQSLRRHFMEQRLRDALQIQYSRQYAPKWVLEAAKILHSLEIDTAA